MEPKTTPCPQWSCQVLHEMCPSKVPGLSCDHDPRACTCLALRLTSHRTLQFDPHVSRCFLDQFTDLSLNSVLTTQHYGSADFGADLRKTSEMLSGSRRTAAQGGRSARAPHSFGAQLISELALISLPSFFFTGCGLLLELRETTSEGTTWPSTP